MITVIKHGNKNDLSLYKVTCSCGCVFTFEPSDIRYYSDGHFVFCPECLKSIRTKMAVQVERSKP